MSSLALTVLSLTLGIFFILIGQFKVTSKFFPEIHEDMVCTHSSPINLSFFFQIRNVNLDVLIKYFHSIIQLVGDLMQKLIE